MSIDWHALGTVFGVTLVATVGLVGVFTLGIVALTKRGAATAAGADSASVPAPAAGPGGGAVLARTGGVVCFAACAAAVAYGIYLIVA
jgi:hypothetical protein